MALIGQWKFDETSGAIAVDSVAARNATLNNSPVFSTGLLNNAISLDGVNDYGIITTNPALKTTSFTCSFWVKFPVKVDQSRIFGCESGNRGWSIILQTGSFAALAYNTSGVLKQAISTFGTPAINTWYFIAISVDDTTKALKIYVNNNAAITNTFTGTQGYDSTNFGIGTYVPALNHFYNGLIDDVRIYDTALTASDISNLYNSAPKLRYKMDEGSGTTVANTGIWQSGTTHNMSIINSNGNGMWEPGIINYGLKFDGVDDRTTTNTSGLWPLTTTCSMSAWVKYNQTVWANIVGRGSWSSNASDHTFWYTTTQRTYGPNGQYTSDIDGKLGWMVGYGGQYTPVTQGMTIPTNNLINDNQWHHVVGVRNGANFQLYVDNVLNKTYSATWVTITLKAITSVTNNGGNAQLNFAALPVSSGSFQISISYTTNYNGIYTLTLLNSTSGTISAPYVSNQTGSFTETLPVSISVNGTLYTQAFTTNIVTTLTNLSNQIAVRSDVVSTAMGNYFIINLKTSNANLLPLDISAYASRGTLTASTGTMPGFDTGFASNTAQFSLGRNAYGSGGTYYSGSVDQVQVFTSALTQAQVTELWNEQPPILCWNYKARYKNSNRLYSTNGGGKAPKELKIPSSVDITTGVMNEDGLILDSSKFKIIQ